MQMTIDVGYDQVFQLVRQLSPKEKVWLVREGVLSNAFADVSEPEISDE